MRATGILGGLEVHNRERGLEPNAKLASEAAQCSSDTVRFRDYLINQEW